MMLKVSKTSISDVILIEPKVYKDDRGFFFESFNEQAFHAAINRKVSFVQDNHSQSVQDVLRGLHYQIKQPQAKLVRVVSGRIYDVAVDLRQSSSTFKKYFGVELSATNSRQLWIPEGCAHGFIAMSPQVEVLYKATDYYAPEHERCLLWNDKAIGIDWPLGISTPIISEKDQQGSIFSDIELFI